MNEHDAADDTQPVPKLWGTDIELCNFIQGLDAAGGTGPQVSRMLLREIDGLPLPGSAPLVHVAPAEGPATVQNGWGNGGGAGGKVAYNAQDWGRKCLPGNAGFAYVDLDHLEICTPETRSVVGHIGLRHAMLRIAAEARRSLNRQLRAPFRAEVVANNSDGRGNSYGSHHNILTTRAAFDRIFNRPHYLGSLAAFQASFLICSGQGKVGSENGRPPCRYQISQRADFIETLVGPQTTHNRTLVNSRDEALAGPASGADAPANRLARLHIIYLDSALCQGTIFLAAAHSILLAQFERARVNPRLQLEDPVAACWRWSHDPDLQTRLPLLDGTRVTAAELQQLFAEDAAKFVDEGGCDGGVLPEARKVLDCWTATLEILRSPGRLQELVGRLDWVLKKFLLERAIEAEGLDWEDPKIRFLDQLYGSLDTEEGLYWKAERAGIVERHVGDDEIDRLTRQPPEDSRAWTRAMILRSLDPESVRFIDWDAIHFREDADAWRDTIIRLGDPLAFTRAEASRREETTTAKPKIQKAKTTKLKGTKHGNAP